MMTTFYALGARLSGMAALVCAALALLSAPAARADVSDCHAECAQLFDPSTQYPDFVECTGLCGGDITVGCDNSRCSNGCIQSFPTCGSGKCDRATDCVQLGCGCKLLLIDGKARFCECKV